MILLWSVGEEREGSFPFFIHLVVLPNSHPQPGIWGIYGQSGKNMCQGCKPDTKFHTGMNVCRTSSCQIQ